MTTSSTTGVHPATSGIALSATRKLRRESCCSDTSLLRSVDETLNLFDGIIDLHVDELFAKVGGRAAGVAADPVTDARRVATRAAATTGATSRRVTSCALTASTSAAASS